MSWAMQQRPDLVGAMAGPEAAASHPEFVEFLMMLDESQLTDVARTLLADPPGGVSEQLLVHNLAVSVDLSLLSGDVAAARRALAILDGVAQLIDQDWARSTSHFWTGQLRLREGAPGTAAHDFHQAAERAPDLQVKA